MAKLLDPLPDLTGHWGGGAAQSFVDYTTRFVEGAGQEGPLNRLAGQAYLLLSAQFEKVADFVVNKLGYVADQIAERAVTTWIPVWGQVRTAQFIRNAYDIFRQTKEVVDQLQSAAGNLQTLISAAQNPGSTLPQGGQLGAVSWNGLLIGLVR